MSFDVLCSRPETVRALKEMGIVTPTPIQKKAIPLIMSGKDVIGKSKTGSGKTAAFGVPVLEKIVPGEGLYALIVTPTRELADQISKELKKFGRYLNSSIVSVYGGVSINSQIEEISEADIVVGTPGRLLDHLRRRTLDLSQLKCFALDEADKLVEMGFIEDIKKMLDHTPKNRQILLFGATISREIDQLKKRYMNHPIVAQAELQVTEKYLKQYYYEVITNEKFSLLVHLLKKDRIERAIVFCSTRANVELVAKNLRYHGIKNGMLHGKIDQGKRLRVIENFHKGRYDFLVASPVAARGLDIKDVTHILNYDLSQDPQEYMHRIGRTARAGGSGEAITLLSPEDHMVFRNICKSHKVKVKALPQEEYPRLKFKKENRSFESRRRHNSTFKQHVKHIKA